MSKSTQLHSAYHSLWMVLLPQQRRSTLMLFGGVVVGTFLELVGVGMVLPIMAVITQEAPSERYPAFKVVLSTINSLNKETIVVFAMLTLLFVYAVRTAFLALLAWQQTDYIFKLQASISQRLFNGYLNQPYEFHLSRNSAQLIRNTIGQVGSLVGAVQQVIMLMTEVLVLLAFTVFLIIVEPVGVMLMVGVLGGIGSGFIHLTKKRLMKWGAELQGHETKRVQYLQETLGSVKEIKLMGREKTFEQDFEWHNYESARVQGQQTLMAALPRLGLELMSIAGLVFLVLIMVWRAVPFDNLIPTMAVFGAAAFRLMPSVNRLVVGIQHVRFSMPVIENISREIKSMQMQSNSVLSGLIQFNDSIELNAVEFQYEGSKSPAVQNINIKILKGQAIGFVGSSGSGKSTLIDLVLGLITPTSGIIYVDGTDIRTNLRDWQDKIGYVPQHVALIDDTLRRNIALGVPDREIDDSALELAINAAQLDVLIKSLPLGIETMIGERGARFSGGQRQRIGIARALYNNPDVLILDEATSALDNETELTVMQAIGNIKRGKTVIAIAHRLSTVEQFDYIYRMEGGVVVQQGTANEVLRSAVPVHAEL